MGVWAVWPNTVWGVTIDPDVGVVRLSEGLEPRGCYYWVVNGQSFAGLESFRSACQRLIMVIDWSTALTEDVLKLRREKVAVGRTTGGRVGLLRDASRMRLQATAGLK